MFAREMPFLITGTREWLEIPELYGACRSYLNKTNIQATMITSQKPRSKFFIVVFPGSNSDSLQSEGQRACELEMPALQE